MSTNNVTKNRMEGKQPRLTIVFWVIAVVIVAVASYATATLFGSEWDIMTMIAIIGPALTCIALYSTTNRTYIGLGIAFSALGLLIWTFWTIFQSLLGQEVVASTIPLIVCTATTLVCGLVRVAESNHYGK